MVATDPDNPLTDPTLAEEIALLGDVMAGAADAGRPLSQAEVDQALGLTTPESRVHGRSGPPVPPHHQGGKG
jgi:hypothetical protein